MTRKLMDKHLRQSLPSFEAIRANKNPMVHAKYHHASTDWTWWAIAFDGHDVLWGLVLGDECELGHFSLSGLKYRGIDDGVPVIRDRAFKPCLLADLFPLYRVRG